MSKIGFINFSPRGKKSTSFYLASQLNLSVDFMDSNDILADQAFDHLDQYDTLILGSPLYVDSIPSKGLMFLESYEEYLNINPQSKNLYGIVCCGFPESHQTRIALEILSHFAQTVGFPWQGGFGVGSGEFIGQSQAIPITSKLKGPLKEKIDTFSHAVLKKENYDIQFCDSFMPRWFFIASGTTHWYSMIKSNGLKRTALKNTPLI